MKKYIVLLVLLSLCMLPVIAFAQEVPVLKLGDQWDSGDPEQISLSYLDNYVPTSSAQDVIAAALSELPITVLGDNSMIRVLEGMLPTERILNRYQVNFHYPNSDVCVWVTSGKVAAYVQINDTYCGNVDIHPNLGVFSITLEDAKLFKAILAASGPSFN